MIEQLTATGLPAVTHLRVSHEGDPVGTLALSRAGLVAFEYSESWLAHGFSLNPLSLPLEKRVFLPRADSFEGLFGVFNESLPDDWGWLLVDRILRERGVEPASLHRVARLAIVGTSGMGALTYEPELEPQAAITLRDLDTLAEECAAVLEARQVDDLDELFVLGGSSGGARPKILTEVAGEPWIIKFPSSIDGVHSGLMEYEYSLAAKACGIAMPETRLFPSKQGPGFFGVKRFDRETGNSETRRIHMASVSALLETTHRVPNLDYTVIARLLLKLTSDLGEVEKLFKQMCFNVLAHNQDDHSKNFALLYSRVSNAWRLSPAFDLTYSTGMMGEHATTVRGKGKDISVNDLIECGTSMGLRHRSCQKIALAVEEIAVPLVEKWER
jgi:serine/threonine-protein kinase HipA